MGHVMEISSLAVTGKWQQPTLTIPAPKRARDPSRKGWPFLIWPSWSVWSVSEGVWRLNLSLCAGSWRQLRLWQKLCGGSALPPLGLPLSLSFFPTPCAGLMNLILMMKIIMQLDKKVCKSDISSGALGKLKQMKGRQDPAGSLIPSCLLFGVAELPAGTQPGAVPPDLLAACRVLQSYGQLWLQHLLSTAGFLYQLKVINLSGLLCWASQMY